MDWNHVKSHTLHLPDLRFTLDYSRMSLPEDFFPQWEEPMGKAFRDMEALERGAIANPDESRMVGHYWLRRPELAPDEAIAQAIRETLERIEDLAGKVHSGEIAGAAGKFENLLVIGIGGSALGPQFVADALGHPKRDRLRAWFFDNTDPDGIDRTLAALDGHLGKTLAVVISKSGGTPETRNGMLEAEHAWKAAGFAFGDHAIAVTGEDSRLDRHARDQGWIARFPMWDWVGGRTSETGPVGLIPAALQGFRIREMLDGAAAMDEATRKTGIRENPAALMALLWHHATGGKGEKDMVVLPYKDRLQLFSRYLQQLVMESLGKEKDLHGRTVHQGIAVYGNKGSTDQHAYIQQLREGVPNFFATFIEVLTDRAGDGSFEIEPGTTSGDYLQGFLLGTRDALAENGRESFTLTVPDVTPFYIGLLIALYERAVGYYATLTGINAYHQPGVEAGKKAAAVILELQRQILEEVRASGGKARTADEVAEAIGASDQTETVFRILEHLAANRARGIRREVGQSYFETRYRPA